MTDSSPDLFPVSRSNKVSTIEVERLLQEISPEAPSGENDLAHDSVFMELETDIQGTPRIDSGGKVIQEAKDPNWSKIQESALELLGRTHDLRVAVSLTRALLHTEGLQGLHAGLSLLRGYVERYWDTLYPRLDPEDDNDPTERVNVLEALGDWNMMIAPLMKARLCSSRTAGHINLRQYRIAAGKAAELTVSDEEKKTVPTLATIEGAFADCSLDELQTNREHIGGSLHALNDLEAVLGEKVGSADAPDLKQLNDVLREIDNLLGDQLARREPLKSSNKQDKPRKAEESSKPDRVQDRQPGDFPEGRSFDMVESREDVLRILDQVCTYYELFEPASPVPLLLKRAMRLVEKNFLEIIEDLAPDSIAQIEKICGSREGTE
jgi:type VI secretion system protein ImpA